MRITYYDHFGLDKVDLSDEAYGEIISPNDMQGFRQWFILQHWKGLGHSVQPKPFITTVEFTTTFSGVIN